MRPWTPSVCHKQITERQVSGKTEGLLIMQDCEGDRSRCVTWWGIQSGVLWRCVKSSFLRTSWSWELYLRRLRSWEFYLRRSRSWETQRNRTYTQEDRWRGFWETTVQVSSSNERKVIQVLFRVVNRRPDDECQRACGIYGCDDKEYRCGWSEFRWLWSGDCRGRRWLGLWLSDTTPSSRGGSWRPYAATGATPASGCGTIGMGVVELL